MEVALSQQAGEIFAEICDLPIREQELVLGERCAQSPELRRLVEELLEGDRQPLAVLEEPAIHQTDLPIAPRGETPVPETIGRYRILRKVGEGGMGIVYEAEQESPRRHVAVKVLRSSIVTGALRRRFLDEAEILGCLDHPGIAQVFEAGVADGPTSGQPFFAMQYVDGERLTDHARNKDRGLRARVELLASICDAVEHAHQKGIVHQDLKPANILVDADGSPRVLDFGIARATAAHAQPESDAASFVSGTLPYMSPDQFELDQVPLDTRSDIYALGVVGYELLTGRLPYAVEGDDVDAARQVIRDQPPATLELADRRLGRELSAVFERALAKDREARYATVSALAADLRRCLAGLPLEARPASGLYRLRLAVRRHRTLTGLVVAVVLAVVTGVLGIVWQAQQTRDAATRALAATAEASLYHARLAAQRGDWDRALAAYDQALEADYADAIEVRLGKVEAWDGRMDYPLVLSELESLWESPDLGPYRARVLLLQGIHHVEQEQGEGLDLIRAALDESEAGRSTLSQGQEELARAFLAEDLGSLRDHLRAAIRHDDAARPDASDSGSTGRRARMALSLVLLMLGEFDEARRLTGTLLALYPGDPSVRFLRGLALAMGGDEDEEVTRILEDLSRGAQVQAASLIQFAAGFAVKGRELDRAALQSLFGEEEKPGASIRNALEILSVMGRSARIVTVPDSKSGPLKLRMTVTPAVGRVVQRVLHFILVAPAASLLPGFGPRSPEEDLEELREICRVYPSGICFFLRGLAELGCGEPLQAEATMLRARAMPSPIPLPRAPLYFALEAQLRQSRERGPRSAHARNRAVRSLDRLVALEEPTAAEFRYLCDAAWELEEADCAASVAARWGRALEDPDGFARLAWIHFRQGHEGEAREAAGQALLLQPDHADATRIAEALADAP